MHMEVPGKQHLIERTYRKGGRELTSSASLITFVLGSVAEGAVPVTGTPGKFGTR
jgi:hypothetical protein